MVGWERERGVGCRGECVQGVGLDIEQGGPYQLGWGGDNAAAVEGGAGGREGLKIDKGYQCGLLLQGAPVEVSTFNRRYEGRPGGLESLCNRSARNTNLRFLV